MTPGGGHQGRKFGNRRLIVTGARAVDGDTVDCWIDLPHYTRSRSVHSLSKICVRLHAIDAPELDQPYGREAPETLQGILSTNQFWLEVVQDKDRYGRWVGVLYPIWTPMDDSVNRRMVAEGFTYSYTRYGGTLMGYDVVEGQARQTARGLWKNSPDGGERPWDFRRRRMAEDRMAEVPWGQRREPVIQRNRNTTAWTPPPRRQRPQRERPRKDEIHPIWFFVAFFVIVFLIGLPEECG
jgi:endonuclease YncB( thermonuclease family)